MQICRLYQPFFRKSEKIRRRRRTALWIGSECKGGKTSFIKGELVGVTLKKHVNGG